MAKRKTWYGVRSILRGAPVGRPLGTDSYQSSAMTLVEERVVLVRASSFKEALALGEKEARAYAARIRHRNRYGQRVRWRFLLCDAYLIDETPVDLVEVFSTSEVIPKTTSDAAVLHRTRGLLDEPRRQYRLRVNICDMLFTGTAPGVVPTRTERAFARRFGMQP